MPELRSVAISGSPRAPSKSKTLAELMLQSLARAGCATDMIDIAELPADALAARAATAQMDAAIAAVGAAHIVVAASPTYRALYTGVMKCFFDLMPHAHLAGKICVPIQTAASPQHFLAIEYGMRPALRQPRRRRHRRRLRDRRPVRRRLSRSTSFSARIEAVAAAAVSLARGSAA